MKLDKDHVRRPLLSLALFLKIAVACCQESSATEPKSDVHCFGSGVQRFFDSGLSRPSNFCPAQKDTPRGESGGV